MNFLTFSGCFPCESCVGDLMNATTLMKDSFEPIKKEFEGVESSVFANRRLKYLDREIEKKMPEMELLNPEERIRR